MTASAGILLYRLHEGALSVLLAHPGGPYWARKDHGAWSLPKGELAPGEPPEVAARREFREETGHDAEGPLVPLGTCRQRSGKQVHAFAVEGEFDPASLVSNAIEIEWPPRSGVRKAIPEIDRVAWFDLATARERILPAQAVFLERLEQLLGNRAGGPGR